VKTLRERMAPRRPSKIAEVLKRSKEFRNLYWNSRKGHDLIPQWQEIGNFEKA